MKKLPQFAKEMRPVLASHGTVPKSSTWRRDNGWCVDIVEFQLAKSCVRFWINIAVLVKSVYSLAWGEDVPTFPRAGEGTIEARVGALSGGDGIWMDVDDDTWIFRATDSMQSEVLPFFDRMHTRSELKDYICKFPRMGARDDVYLAILLLEDGEEAEGCALLRRAKAYSPQRVERVAARWKCADV